MIRSLLPNAGSMQTVESPAAAARALAPRRTRSAQVDSVHKKRHHRGGETKLQQSLRQEGRQKARVTTGGEPDSRSILRQTETGQKMVGNVGVRLEACIPWSESILQPLITPMTNPTIVAEHELCQRWLGKATSAMKPLMIMRLLVVQNKSATN